MIWIRLKYQAYLFISQINSRYSSARQSFFRPQPLQVPWYMEMRLFVILCNLHGGLCQHQSIWIRTTFEFTKKMQVIIYTTLLRLKRL